MVIGESFAWGHIGKTGGDATASLFAAINGLAQTIDPTSDIHKHDTFQYRGVKDKVLVLNIRRLSSWVISYYNHHYLSPVGFDTLSSPSVAPGNPKFLTSEDKILFQCRDRKIDLSVTTLPDRMLKIYVADQEIYWLRMESLRRDFINFVNKFFRRLTTYETFKVLTLRTKKNNPYDHDINRWFSCEQITQLYKNNPLWASIEQQHYVSPLKNCFSFLG